MHFLGQAAASQVQRNQTKVPQMSVNIMKVSPRPDAKCVQLQINRAAKYHHAESFLMPLKLPNATQRAILSTFHDPHSVRHGASGQIMLQMSVHLVVMVSRPISQWLVFHCHIPCNTWLLHVDVVAMKINSLITPDIQFKLIYLAL